MTGDVSSLQRAVGKIEGLVESLEQDMGNYREDKKAIYERINAMEHKLDSLPTEEEWILIKQMATAQADKAKFWADLRKAMASRGLIAATGVAIIYFWDALVLVFKTKMGV